jgi:hypothetical protein
MKSIRAVAIVLLSFLVGGSSAEVAVQTHRVLHRARSAEAGEGGDLVALEVRGEAGELIARPRVITTPGRAAHLVLRDPADPERVRLTLRVEASREPSGDVAVDYELSLPEQECLAAGRLSATPGVEEPIDLGHLPITATLLTLPVPSAAFDAFLESERRIRT